MVTLGIVPTEPVTGYGYIKVARKGRQTAGRIRPVERFVEKPDLATARRYLASGDYLWNSGMFIWSVPVVLAAFAAGVFWTKTSAPATQAVVTSTGEADQALAAAK